MENKQRKNIANDIRSIVLQRFLLKVVVNGLAVTLLIFSVLYASSADILLSIGFMVLVFLVTLIRSYRQKREQLSDALIFRNFDREFSEMENSSHLLQREYSELNDLEKLQYEKIKVAISGIIERFQPQIRIKRAFYFLIFSLITCTLIVLYSIYSEQSDKEAKEHQTESHIKTSGVNEKGDFPIPLDLSIRVISPGYTKIRNKEYVIEDIEVVENSILTFSASFTAEVENVNLLLNNNKIPFKWNSDKYEVSVKMKKPSIYQIEYSFQDSSILASSLHQIKVKLDESPEIEVTGLESYQIIEEAYGDPSFGISIKDDFGIDGGHIVATITKGEGESVKFREENIPFTSKLKKDQKRYSGDQKINLSELGMEPGDELYFYVQASDNKNPESNVTRSQTFFIVMPDSTREVITMSAGIGVDLMPEYFRSQRQIIIDTEKLIAEKNKISKKEFDSRSNELGYDQKQLRLRYGQFMGEEFETEIGGSLSESDHDHDHGEENENQVMDFGSILERYGHAHDTEDVADRGVLDIDDHGHSHDHDHSGEIENELEKGKDAEAILEELTHSHDSEESANLFFESSKVKLRAALSLMWTSELHLRLSEPETALPVEYEILKLLKEVQQMSRIYVQRIGFDPPPIKEYEKRLTGEINEISSYENVEDTQNEESFEKTIAYVVYLDNVLELEQSHYQLSVSGIKEVKEEISNKIHEDPIKYFGLIDRIQIVESGEPIGTEDVLYLQKALGELIGGNIMLDLNPDGTLNPLNEIYLDEITNSNP